MREGSGSADISPTPFSLVAFKPRQILLLQQQRQRNSLVVIPMGKNQTEIPAKLKPEQETILASSIALWLESKGFSKVLSRFLSAAQIQDENWKANALNLNEVFSKYQEVGGDVHENLHAQKKQEEQVVAANKNGDVQSVMPDEKSKKKKRKNKEAATHNAHTSETMAVVNEKVKKCDENGDEDKINETSVAPIVSEQKSVPMKESEDANIREVPLYQSAKAQKVKKTKKSNQRLDTAGIDEELIDVMADSELTMESKDIKKGKKLRDNLLNADKVSEPVVDKTKIKKKSKKEAISVGELPSSGAEINRKSSVKATEDVEDAEDAEDAANESKKVTKKRKRMAGEDNQNQAIQESAVEESKPKKAKGLEEGKNAQLQIALDGADESSKDHPDKGVDKSIHSKSGRKEPNSSSKLPKTVNAFQRVKVDEVKIDDRLQDNSYWAKGGADIGYGAKAQEVLGQVKGKDFRHEKTKKKRGSYRGGQIDLQSHSIKFANSDDE